MEARAASLKEEKADLLKDMEELENQVVMWEKKIKLEKEMQETLDPTGMSCIWRWNYCMSTTGLMSFYVRVLQRVKVKLRIWRRKYTECV